MSQELTSYSWDEYFISMAYLVSMKSKDPSTRVGAVIVDNDHSILATGYNGLPRKIADETNRYEDKYYKYLVSNHAEENAILHCAKKGISIDNAILYTTWLPCALCAKSIIQVGIKTIIYHGNFPGNHIENQSNWEKSIEISLAILKEADIDIKIFNGTIIKIEGLYKEKKFQP